MPVSSEDWTSLDTGVPSGYIQLWQYKPWALISTVRCIRRGRCTARPRAWRFAMVRFSGPLPKPGKSSGIPG
ncbi:hypothetical protein TRIP_E290004 [uncultured Spirochaetota bacterium]|nr:hypothetical protein TRIP_E290004 [uncultured Spirochaetota bacterium]